MGTCRYEERAICQAPLVAILDADVDVNGTSYPKGTFSAEIL